MPSLSFGSDLAIRFYGCCCQFGINDSSGRKPPLAAGLTLGLFGLKCHQEYVKPTHFVVVVVFVVANGIGNAMKEGVQKNQGINSM